MTISSPDPTCTLEHEEQTWRVTLTQGGKEYAIYLTREGTGLINVTTNRQKQEFVFQESHPDMVLAIGRLLVAAARKAGAMDL